MKLLVIVLCLLSERYLIHSISYNRFSWFPAYARKIAQILGGNSAFSNPWIVLACLVLPIVLGVTVVYWVIHGIFFGFMGLLLSLLIFAYCLGPQNAFYPLASNTTSEQDATAPISAYFASVNSQLFSVIFWYILTGPIGVLAYRLVSLCDNIEGLDKQAKQLTDILEWIPARITALLYLLVGNFQAGFSVLRQFIVSKPDLNNRMLSECGLKAAGSREADELSLSIAEHLVEHAVIVLLVLIALCTLVAWL